MPEDVDDIDDREELMEDQMDAQKEYQDESYGQSTYQPKDDLYSLFWKVVKIKDSSKTGNLSKEELGILDLSVRDCQRIALLAITLGHLEFAKFFTAVGEITLATSASKKGWLAELFVTARKLQTKTRKREIGIKTRKKALIGAGGQNESD